MSLTGLVIVFLVVVISAAAAILVLRPKLPGPRLRDRFGPEYDLVVEGEELR